MKITAHFDNSNESEGRGTVTLTTLYRRLGEIIEYNKRRGWDERNHLPMYASVSQASTPSGRTREPVMAPVRMASDCMHVIDGKHVTMILVDGREAKIVK